MYVAKDITQLKETVEEAKDLLLYYQQELDKDPNDFAQQVRFNSFKGHVGVLESQLAKYTSQAEEIKEDISYEMLQKRFRLMNELDFYANIGIQHLEKLINVSKVIHADLDSLALPI